jgi:hypothetical protein
MSPWFFGYLGAAGGVDGAFDLLETTVLSSNGEVYFTGLDAYSDYKHLQLRFTGAASTSGMQFTFNNDLTDKYMTSRLKGVGSNTIVNEREAALRNTIRFDGAFVGNTNFPNYFAGGVIDILDYSSANKKTTVRGIFGNSTGSGVMLGMGFYDVASAVTALTIYSSSGSPKAGSRFSLYGIRG